ncbi:hypothetical protein B5M42_017755 [Paenibacillus athensensis]|uniref:YmaF family protein n=1 Tax=Paenibacillus athensensis TaxID=1967502 RepID=A0A4Y8Q177_9BACL|nr:YmaF family protein [Paenibacillus athensensis]MCD1260649.1 hypothetical protein [Paenibacillus athensensis]
MAFCQPYSDVPPAHAHFLKVITGDCLGHHHLMRAYTFSVNGTAYDGHVHEYQGITAIRYGHYHSYAGTTGPAIPLPDGSHYHLAQGLVQVNAYNTSRGKALVRSAQTEGLIRELHHHTYNGATSLPLGMDTWP